MQLSPWEEENDENSKVHEILSRYGDLSEQDRPEEVSSEVWSRFAVRRKHLIEKEIEVAKAGAVHSEMQRHLALLEAGDAALQSEIRQLTFSKSELAESRVVALLNSELFLRVPQGLVEIVEAPVVTDLRDSLLVQRDIVEDLNGVIVGLGNEKVAMLSDMAESKKGISQLLWKQKSLQLEHKDCMDTTTELQLLRVTKSLQSLIKAGGHDTQTAAEFSRLERKIEFLVKVSLFVCLIWK